MDLTVHRYTPYSQILGRTHSKLISDSPDSYFSNVINTNGKTRESVIVGGTGNT